MNGPNPGQVQIPANLVVMRRQEDGSALLPAHQVTELLRTLSVAFRDHPELDPAEGLAALADQLDLIVIAALDQYAEEEG
ncbi:hypothetical protein ACPCTN_31860 [Streptomyces cinereoruber]|uniref:hypothetical protein n=1 Tax=Streptomyces cinereoruber TaxID=67260 RepID=UPI003C2E229C